jgi:nucleoside phosphorylase
MDTPTPTDSGQYSELLASILKRAKSRRDEEGPAPGIVTPEKSASEGTLRQPMGASRISRRVSSQPADVAVVVALPVEREKLLAALGGAQTDEVREGVMFRVVRRLFCDEEATVAVAQQITMGMVPAAILAGKAIKAWSPKIVAMTGICAGIKEKVRLGDIIVGRHVFDYGSGKLEGGRLHPDYEPVVMDEDFCGYAANCANDAQLLSRIRALWPVASGRPVNDLEAHVGSLASGAAVVADETVVRGIQEHKRSLLGVDMEAYGLARAACSASPRLPFVIVKGVQDFADSAKNDEYREYAAFVSAHFFTLWLERHWSAIATKSSAPSSIRSQQP